MEKPAGKVVEKMNFIDRSAELITKSIRNNYSEAGSEAALKYALILFINTLTTIVVALLFCTVTGHFSQCIIAIISFTLLRYVSGGMHLSSSLSCCMFSSLMLITISFIDFHYSQAFLLIDIISLLILLKNAPKDIQGVSSINPRFYPLLKAIAVLIVASNFFIQSTIFTAAFIFDALLTTLVAYKIRDFFEGR